MDCIHFSWFLHRPFISDSLYVVSILRTSSWKKTWSWRVCEPEGKYVQYPGYIWCV